jgi:hypothetical protein
MIHATSIGAPILPRKSNMTDALGIKACRPASGIGKLLTRC